MWFDLTVPDADEVLAFYQSITGYSSEALDMGDYDDYILYDLEAKPLAGICHARGVNAELPAQWLVYFTVNNLEESMLRCEAFGGKIVSGPRSSGNGTYCVIRDPAGAHAALFEPKQPA
jgi:predicted enzyme related to lactoylglutathione lyase